MGILLEPYKNLGWHRFWPASKPKPANPLRTRLQIMAPAGLRPDIGYVDGKAPREPVDSSTYLGRAIL